MKVYVVAEVYLHAFLTSALDRGKGKVHILTALALAKGHLVFTE
jgi:hypothetical protein